MASEWRQNVADVGLSGGYVDYPGIGGHVTLVARLKTWYYSGAYVCPWVVGRDYGFGTVCAYGYQSFGDPAQCGGCVNFIPGVFPGGLDVFPDN